jgi:hypothetical protein
VSLIRWIHPRTPDSEPEKRAWGIVVALASVAVTWDMTHDAALSLGVGGYVLALFEALWRGHSDDTG